MATKTIPETTESTALVAIEHLTPMQLFAPGVLNPIIDRIKAEVRAIETDISTEAGRKAIASLAYKVARTKTFIDAQRITLVSDEKKRLAAIDAEGRHVREELDALKDEVEGPLTAWKNSEKDRIAEHERRIDDMNAVGEVDHYCLENIATARTYLDERWNHNFQEFTKRATQAHEKALLHLQIEEKSVREAEEKRVEAERLRAEAAENARIAREAQIAKEAREKAEAEVKRREEARARAAKQREEEMVRLAAEEKSRLEREKVEAEQKAADERARIEREAKASQERLQKSLDDARVRAQREKLAAQERERKAEADRIAAAEKTEADRIEAEKRAAADREAAVAAERRRQEALQDSRIRAAAQEAHDLIADAVANRIDDAWLKRAQAYLKLTGKAA